MDLRNKVVLITGATGGIGAAVARSLATEHCRLSLVGRREEQLKSITQDLQKQQCECIYKTGDVTQKHDVQETVEFTVQHYGRIDIAILTAGILVPNPIETFDSTIIRDTMESNFFGTVYYIESLLPIMKQQKAGIIAATSTLPDRRGVPGWGAYGASKAAVSWLMESLRAEAQQKYNIRMITIKPGSVKTPMIEGLPRKGAISPNTAATYIIKGIKKEKKIIQFPFFQVLTIRLTDQFPTVVYDNIPIDLQKGEGYPNVKEKPF